MSNADLRWLSLASAVALALSACGGGDAGSASDAGTDTGFDFDTDYPYDLDAGLRCDGGVDVMQPSPDGVGEIPTGLEQCPDGSRHRYTTVPCTYTINTVDDGCSEGDCSVDECPPGLACAGVSNFDGPDCGCVKPCASDADCALDEACVCSSFEGWISRCYRADCHVDDDCGGFVCGLFVYDSCYDPKAALGCHSAADECRNDMQCDWMEGDYCGYDFETGVWECFSGVECDA